MLITFINSTIMTLILLSFLMYFSSNHPMMIGFMVIFQCMLTSSFLTSKMKFSWFSFFIFIIYLGGILMLFSYIISLINSHKPVLKIYKSSLIVSMSYFLFSLNSEKESFLEISTNKFFKLIMSCFSSSSMKMSIFFMLFLLMIMVIVVFMTEMSKGTMRKF